MKKMCIVFLTVLFMMVPVVLFAQNAADGQASGWDLERIVTLVIAVLGVAGWIAGMLGKKKVEKALTSVVKGVEVFDKDFHRTKTKKPDKGVKEHIKALSEAAGTEDILNKFVNKIIGN